MTSPAAAHLLFQALDHYAEATPDAIALVTKQEEISYKELRDESCAVANRLAALGVKQGAWVGLLCEKGRESVAGLLGILRHGGAYVPLDPFAPKKRNAGIVDKCKLAAVIASQARLKADVPALLEVCETAPLVLSSEAPAKPEERMGEAPEIFAWNGASTGFTAAHISDLATSYVLHTSGSTGVPKGVMHSHRSAMTFVRAAAAQFEISQADVLVSHAPIHFDLSVFDLFCAWQVGAKVVLLPEFFAAFPHKIAQWVSKYRITIWNSVASALTLLNQKGRLEKADLSSLRAVIFSGERMPLTTLRGLQPHLPAAKLYNVYGQTEANSSLAYEVTAIPEGDETLPIGSCLPNFEAVVVDADDEVLDGPDAQGELLIRASSVAQGYFQNPEKTQLAFVADPEFPERDGRLYRTGDRVRRDRHGVFHFLGRRDHLIKIRGYRVELGEVELALCDIPGVAAAGVHTRHEPDGNLGLVGYVEPREDATDALSEKDVLRELSTRIPKYMLPAELRVLPSLPRTSTGKVDRNALAQTTSSA